MTVDRLAFCRSLKDTRLRRGLTLESIAESSKIQASLLGELERGDLSRWPKGIFRRAFFREYAAAIGLPPEKVVHDLGRLFPEEGEPLGVPGSRSNAGHDPDDGDTSDELRLTLAPDESWWTAPAVRVLAAFLDLLIVLLAGAIVGRAVGSFALGTCLVALIYYAAGTAYAGATPASVWLNRSPRPRSARQRPHVGALMATERPTLVFRRPEPAHQSVPAADADPTADTRRAASN